jgi:ditrans,polycis-polyprenyl diphosphate synthase
MHIPGLEWACQLARKAAAASLSLHPVPRHIAFIMDGNRRYADRQHIERIDGHTEGYHRLIKALEWCLDLGVGCVSVYAFSIDNFLRSEVEVASLMKLAEEKLTWMLEEAHVLRQHGVRVKVIGDLELAPLAVRNAAAKVMAATAKNDGAVLNICFAYTSSRELQQALEKASLEIQQQSRFPRHHQLASAADSPAMETSHDSTPRTTSNVDKYLYTADCPSVDLMIRTSGETRLSDFLLRQSAHSVLHFTRVLWPDFTFLDLVSAILDYQRQHDWLQHTIASAHAATAERQRSTEAATLSLRSGPPLCAEPTDCLAAAHEVPATRQLRVKTSRENAAAESPTGVATPGSTSSPSCRSERSSFGGDVNADDSDARPNDCDDGCKNSRCGECLAPSTWRQRRGERAATAR